MPNENMPDWVAQVVRAAEPGQFYNPIPGDPPMPAQPPRPVFFGNGRAKKAPPMPVGLLPMFDDDYLKLLLNGVQEIFEAECFISGPAIVEKQLGAKSQKSPIFVTMVLPDQRLNFDAYHKFINKFEELGWGPLRERPSKDKNYWVMYEFTVRGRSVILGLREKHEGFDDYGMCVNMIRYTLEKGWEQDERSKKDFDNHTITCNKKPDEKRLTTLKEYVAPYLEELTGHKWTVKKDK